MTNPSEAPSTQEGSVPGAGEPDPSRPTAESERILSLRATDSKTLLTEIRRLEREDQDFRAVFSNEAGRRAERQYRPEIEKRDRELADLRAQLKRLNFEKLDDAEVNKRFQEDPEFAKDYAEALHYKPKAPPPVDETPEIEEAWTDLVEYAYGHGLSKEAIETYSNQVLSGKYGGPEVHWRTALSRVERDMHGAILAMKSQAASPPPPKEEVFNDNLTKSGPDTSNNGKVPKGSRPLPRNKDEWNRLSKADKEAILDTPEGFEHVRKLT